MYTLKIGSIYEKFDDLDEAMKNCFEVFPTADFSGWNESESGSWMDVFLDNTSGIQIGKIIEE